MPYNKRQHTVQKAYLELWKKKGNFYIYDFHTKKTHRGDPKSILRKNNIYNWDDFKDWIYLRKRKYNGIGPYLQHGLWNFREFCPIPSF